MGSDQDRASWLFPDFADYLCLFSPPYQAQCIDRSIGVPGSHDRQELALIGNVERVEPKQLTRTANCVAHRDMVFKENNSEPAVTGEFVEGSGSASACGIAHPADARTRRLNQSFDQRKHGTCVGPYISFQIQLSAGQQNSYAMVPDRTGDQHFVAWPYRTRINGYSSKAMANARGRDVHLVCFTVFDDLGVTACDPDSCLLSRFGHGTDFRLQNCGGKSRFEYVADDQSFCFGSRDSQVVHRSVYGKLTDRTTGKSQGFDDKAVGGDGNLRSTDVNERGVAQRTRIIPKQQGSKESFDELAAGFSSSAMGHLDLRIAEPNCCRISLRSSGAHAIGRRLVTKAAFRCS